MVHMKKHILLTTIMISFGLVISSVAGTIDGSFEDDEELVSVLVYMKDCQKEQ